MIEDAIRKIIEIANGKIHTTPQGLHYSRHGMMQLSGPEPTAKVMQLHTLSGLVSYIEDDFDENALTDKYALFVGGPSEVSMVSSISGEFRQREAILLVSPFQSPGFMYSTYMDLEQFVVAMQAHFVIDETVAKILSVVGNIQSEQVATVSDDGISQTVTARSGVARVENVVLPNPVTLRPFRTFQEIDQPESHFVLRLRSGSGGLPQAALFEVGDSQWMLRAVESIREYLEIRQDSLKVFA